MHRKQGFSWLFSGDFITLRHKNNEIHSKMAKKIVDSIHTVRVENFAFIIVSLITIIVAQSCGSNQNMNTEYEPRKLDSADLMTIWANYDKSELEKARNITMKDDDLHYVIDSTSYYHVKRDYNREDSCKLHFTITHVISGETTYNIFDNGNKLIKVLDSVNCTITHRKLCSRYVGYSEWPSNVDSTVIDFEICNDGYDNYDNYEQVYVFNYNRHNKTFEDIDFKYSNTFEYIDFESNSANVGFPEQINKLDEVDRRWYFRIIYSDFNHDGFKDFIVHTTDPNATYYRYVENFAIYLGANGNGYQLVDACFFPYMECGPTRSTEIFLTNATEEGSCLITICIGESRFLLGGGGTDFRQTAIARFQNNNFYVIRDEVEDRTTVVTDRRMFMSMDDYSEKEWDKIMNDDSYIVVEEDSYSSISRDYETHKEVDNVAKKTTYLPNEPLSKLSEWL